MLAAARTNPVRECLPAAEGQTSKQPLHQWIADDPSQALIRVVVGAEHVAVHQQHPVSLDLDDGPVVQQLHAGRGREPRADQEVPVAMDEPARYARIRQLTQRGGNPTLVGIRVVVADPDLEQVPEDVQRAG